MPAGGYQARRPPAHAGRLRAWERVTITVVFVIVTAAITVIMVLTAHPQSGAPSGHAHGRTHGHNHASTTHPAGPGSDQHR